MVRDALAGSCRLRQGFDGQAPRTDKCFQFCTIYFASFACGCLLVCCSCQKKPRRIIFSPRQESLTNVNIPSMAKVKEKNDLSDSINKVHEPKKNDLNCIIGEIESKLTDIPIPPHAIPIPEFFQHTSHEDGISVGYYCEQNRQSLISFYRQQMANGGWRLRGQTDGAETTLLFRKPDRFCTISLRNHRKNSRLQQLVITIINKMELR